MLQSEDLFAIHGNGQRQTFFRDHSDQLREIRGGELLNK